MSANSRSFLRNMQDAIFLNEIDEYIEKTDLKNLNRHRKVLIDFMKRKEFDDRAVFFAENLKILTRDEIEELKNEAKKFFEERKVDGIIEFHLDSDRTSKDAHIHFWGKYNEEVKEAIYDFIKIQNLSNKDFYDYTDENIQYKQIKNDEVVIKNDENETEKISIEEYEENIAIKNVEDKEKDFDELLNEIDEILAEVEFYIDVDVEKEKEEKEEYLKEIYEFEYNL